MLLINTVQEGRHLITSFSHPERHGKKSRKAITFPLLVAIIDRILRLKMNDVETGPFRLPKKIVLRYSISSSASLIFRAVSRR